MEISITVKGESLGEYAGPNITVRYGDVFCLCPGIDGGVDLARTTKTLVRGVLDAANQKDNND